MVKFNKVNEEYGFLSNMSNHPIEYNGKIYPRAEHWFICSRFGFDEHIVARICNISNPITVKILSKEILKETPEKLKVQMLSSEDIENMSKLIELKISQYEWMKWALLATDGEIIEDVTTRAATSDSSLFWGSAVVKPNEQSTPFTVGKNILGILWVMLRAKLTQQLETDGLITKNETLKGNIILECPLYNESVKIVKEDIFGHSLPLGLLIESRKRVLCRNIAVKLFEIELKKKLI